MAFSGVIGEAILRITTDVKGLVSGLKIAGKKLTSFSDGLKTAGNQMSVLASSAIKLGALLAALFVPAIIAGSEFEQAMAGVKAVMVELQDGTRSATASFKALSDKAKELGATTKFTATQVANALEFLGLAGFKAQESLKGVEPVLSLAAAGALQMSQAASIAADTFNAFNFSAESFNRIVDVLAATAANANTTVERLGETMKFVAPTAAAMGQSIETVTVAMGIMANAGIKSSQAGTSLSQIFIQLAKKGDDVNEFLYKYGLAFEDVNPEVVSLTDILKKFQLAAVSTGDIMKIFGARAGRSFLALRNQGVDAFAELKKVIDDAAGSAKLMAEIRMDTFQGDLLKLKSVLETLSIEVFEILSKSLRGLIQTGVEYVSILLKWVEANHELVLTIGLTTAKIIALTAAAGALLIVSKSLLLTWAALSGLFAILTAPAVLITAAILALGGGLAALAVTVKDELAPSFGRLQKGLTSLWKNVLTPIWDAIAEGASTIFPWISSAVTHFIGSVYTLVGRLFELLGSLKFVWQVLGEVGKIIVELSGGAFAVAIYLVKSFILGLSFLIRVAEGIINVFSAVVMKLKEWIDYAWQATMSFLGLRKETEEAAKATASLADESNKLSAAMQKELISSRLATDEARKRNAEAQKAIEILKQLSTTTIVARKDLIEFQKEGLTSIADFNDRLSRSIDERARLEARLASGKSTLYKLEEAKKKDPTDQGTVDAIAAMTLRIKEMEAQLKRVKEEADNTLTVLEELEKLDRMYARGQEGRDEQIAAIRKENEELQKQIEVSKAAIQLSRDRGEDTKEREAELANLDSANAKLKANIQLLTELRAIPRDFGPIDINDPEQMKRLNELAAEQTELLKKQDEALTVIGKKEEDLIKLRQELEDKSLSASQQEITSIRREADARTALTMQLIEAYQWRAKGIERQQKQAQLSLEEAVTDDQVAEAKQRLNDLREEEIDNLQKEAEAKETLVKITEAEEKKINEANRKMAQSRDNFMRDMAIQAAKDNDDYIEEMKLRREKEIEEAKKKFKELELSAEDHAKAMKIIEERQTEELLDEIRRRNRERADFIRQMDIEDAKRAGRDLEAMKLQHKAEQDELVKNAKEKQLTDEQFDKAGQQLLRRQADERHELLKKKAGGDGKDALSKASERQYSLEDKITGQLLGQVKTIRDMYALYQAIWNIRRMQEQAAFNQANAVLMQERRLDKLKARRDKLVDPNGRAAKAANEAIKREQLRLDIMKQIAEKRAGEAQLGDAEGQARAQVLDDTKQKVKAMEDAVALSMQKIKESVTGVKDAFDLAPNLWINAFLAKWENAFPIMLNAIKNSMDMIRLEFQNILADGMAVANQLANISAPALNAGASMSSPASPLSPAGFIGDAGAGSVNNDNRALTMTVNNNVDMDNMTRHVGNIFDSVNSGTGLEA